MDDYENPAWQAADKALDDLRMAIEVVEMRQQIESLTATVEALVKLAESKANEEQAYVPDLSRNDPAVG